MKCAAVVLVLLLVTLPFAAAQPPGHSKAFGKSLGEWMELYWTWFFTGEPADGKVKDVVFLPLPDGEIDVSLKTGQKFVLPIWVIVGETYEGGYCDDPDDYPMEWITDADVLVRLDGRTLVDSEEDDLADFFFEAQWFEETLPYEEPTDYGSTGAIWVAGLALVHSPLSRGSHTLTLDVYFPAWDLTFDNTWHITVGK
ncbi:MAG: hypothetical protein MUE73_05145 [Planctomycetes bacterium]|jgi:hypothetical protein|nr:hypothetical protein [Planctomycetota bacterium]